MTPYNFYKLTFGKNTWSIMCTDRMITIIKTSLPRHMQYGKTYFSWDKVEASYKDANLKTAFLMIQSGLLEPTETLVK